MISPILLVGMVLIQADGYLNPTSPGISLRALVVNASFDAVLLVIFVLAGKRTKGFP